LKRCPSLIELELSNVEFTTDAIQELHGFTKLRKLTAWNSLAEDGVAAALEKSLPNTEIEY
jgi:hypothetical protein